MIKLCGCVNFYYVIPRGVRACNGTEMLCIIANKASIELQSFKDEGCFPDCEGTSLVVYEPYGNITFKSKRLHVTVYFLYEYI